MSGDTLAAEGKFAIVPEWVLYAKIPALAVRLYAVLARHADKHGNGAFPSRRTLSELLDCSSKTVDRSVGELVGIGALSVEARYRSDGGRTSNRYTLRVVPPGHQCPGGVVTHDEAPSSPVTHHERKLLNESPSLLPDEPGEREFPLRLALSAAIGVALDGMTRRERGQWDEAVRDLCAAGATADDVTARCAAYRLMWPDARLTPLAIAKHWSTLGAEVASGKPAGFDGWLEQTAPLLGRAAAHDVIDDMSGLDDAERARRHLLADERFDAIANERSNAA